MVSYRNIWFKYHTKSTFISYLTSLYLVSYGLTKSFTSSKVLARLKASLTDFGIELPSFSMIFSTLLVTDLKEKMQTSMSASATVD